MAILDLELALQHIKSDADEVEAPLVALYLDAAQSICEGYCNRKFYDDDVARYLAFDQGLVALTDAATARDAALDIHEACDIRDAIASRYIERRGAALQAVNGCVADASIKAAILMTFGHLYKNRQDIVIGNVSMVHVPIGAQRILQPYLWIGDLGGS